MTTPFRDAALARLSSPERLDELITVLRPRYWVALTAVVALVLAALVWSFAGTVPLSSTSVGVLVAPGSVREVFAPVTGYVVSIATEDADVGPGQTVATIAPGPGSSPTAEPVQVLSPIAGVVFEREVAEGALVREGQSIARVQTAGAALGRDLRALTYVSPATAATFEAGMVVDITPETVPSAEYGYLRGRIASVATIPDSVAAITAAVQDQTIATELAAAAEGVPIEVRIDLERADTPSGYRWSNGDGPPYPLAHGTFATVYVTTGASRPIDLLASR